MFPNEGGLKHLVRNTKGQWDSKERDGYKANNTASFHILSVRL
jgi:hypothetical protein